MNETDVGQVAAAVQVPRPAPAASTSCGPPDILQDRPESGAVLAIRMLPFPPAAVFSELTSNRIGILDYEIRGGVGTCTGPLRASDPSPNGTSLRDIVVGSGA